MPGNAVGSKPADPMSRYGLAPTQQQGIAPSYRYITRDQGRGIEYQPPGGAPEGGGGQGEQINYDYIRDVESDLKARGITGAVHITDSGDIIRRDGQGRILSITRGASQYQADRARYGGSKRLGGTVPKQRDKRRRYSGDAVGTNREKHRKDSPSTGKSAGSRYPDWVMSMSKWRGV